MKQILRKKYLNNEDSSVTTAVIFYKVSMELLRFNKYQAVLGKLKTQHGDRSFTYYPYYNKVERYNYNKRKVVEYFPVVGKKFPIDVGTERYFIDFADIFEKYIREEKNEDSSEIDEFTDEGKHQDFVENKTFDQLKKKPECVFSTEDIRPASFQPEHVYVQTCLRRKKHVYEEKKHVYEEKKHV